MSDRAANWVLEDNDEGEKGFFPPTFLLSVLRGRPVILLESSPDHWALADCLFFHELDSQKSHTQKKETFVERPGRKKSRIHLLRAHTKGAFRLGQLECR